MTSTSRAVPGAKVSWRDESVTTQRVVPTGDLPVGAGNSNAGAGCAPATAATVAKPIARG